MARKSRHFYCTSCYTSLAHIMLVCTARGVTNVRIYRYLWQSMAFAAASARFLLFSMAFCFLAKHWPAPSLLLPGLRGHGGRLFLFLLLPCHSHAKKERSSTPATLQHIATCCWPACNQITPWSLHSGSSESHRLHLSLPGFSQTKHTNLSGYASACQELQELAVLILN